MKNRKISPSVVQDIVYHCLVFATAPLFAVCFVYLQTSRKDLLALDFEGILKYFRVHLPKKYRSEESARELLNTAIFLKVNTAT